MPNMFFETKEQSIGTILKASYRLRSYLCNNETNIESVKAEN